MKVAAVVLRISGKCEVREVPTPEPPPCRLLRFERSHINGEAVFYIGLEHSLISLIDFLDRDDLYVGCYVMFAAKVKHFLCFGNTSNKRTREASAPRRPLTEQLKESTGGFILNMAK
jgi:hypothetical protein